MVLESVLTSGGPASDSLWSVKISDDSILPNASLSSFASALSTDPRPASPRFDSPGSLRMSTSACFPRALVASCDDDCLNLIPLRPLYSIDRLTNLVGLLLCCLGGG